MQLCLLVYFFWTDGLLRRRSTLLNLSKTSHLAADTISLNRLHETLGFSMASERLTSCALYE